MVIPGSPQEITSRYPLSVNSPDPDLHTDILLYYQRSACALVLLCSAFVFFL